MCEIREMVFLEKKNIAKWGHLATAAKFKYEQVEPFLIG